MKELGDAENIMGILQNYFLLRGMGMNEECVYKGVQFLAHGAAFYTASESSVFLWLWFLLHFPFHLSMKL